MISFITLYVAAVPVHQFLTVQHVLGGVCLG